MNTFKENVRLASYAGLRELIREKGALSAFCFAKECGYSCTELLYIAGECSAVLNEAENLRVAASESGVAVSCISCYVDVVSGQAPYAVDDSAVEAVKRCIDLAVAISCPLVHHTLVTRLSGDRSNYNEVFGTVLEAAGEIAQYARERGITVIYEPQGMLFNGLLGYSEFFDAIHAKHENTGICLDVGNTLWVDEDCYPLMEKYSEHIKHVHLKDYVLGEEGSTYKTLGGTPIKEVALGDGIIDLARVFNALALAGYRGCLSIEDNSCSDYAAIAQNARRIIK